MLLYWKISLEKNHHLSVWYIIGLDKRKPYFTWIDVVTVIVQKYDVWMKLNFFQALKSGWLIKKKGVLNYDMEFRAMQKQPVRSTFLSEFL